MMGGGNSQDCPVVPLRFRQVSAHGVDQDLVFVELEDDVGKPPGPLALYAVASAHRATGGRRGLERSLNDVGDLYAGRQREPSPCAQRVSIWSQRDHMEADGLPEKMRMVSIPKRAMFSPPGGLGVCAREGGMGVTERDWMPGSFESLGSLNSVS